MQYVSSRALLVLCFGLLKSSFLGRVVWLTNWGRDKMAANFQPTYSIAFSWMKMHVFRLRFHWHFLNGGDSVFECFVVLGLTHWGRVTHICVGELTIIGRRQAIIGTNARILLIGPLGTNFSKISIGIQTFSFKKMRLKMSSVEWRSLCLGLNVLI